MSRLEVEKPYLEGVVPERGVEISRMRTQDNLVAVETVRSADKCAVGEPPRGIASKNSISFSDEK